MSLYTPMSKFTPSYWTIDCEIEKPSKTTCIVYATAMSHSPKEAWIMSRVFLAVPEMYELVKDCARTAPPGHYTEALLELQDKARALLARLEKEGVGE